MREKIATVTFNPAPSVMVRVINERFDDTLTIKAKKKYPFELCNNVKVKVTTNKRQFEFNIKKPYAWNGADIPKTLFWVGQSKDNNYLIASMVHDFMLEHKQYLFVDVLKEQLKVKEYRRLTSLVFREILKNQKTNVIKANVMAWFVDVFQATVNRKQWECIE